MKSKQFNKKLTLQKRTVTNLGTDQMHKVYGGSIPNCPPPTLDQACFTLKFTNCPECPPLVSVGIC